MRNIYTLLLLLFVSSLSFSQPAEQPKKSKRPKVGLVLSGGGAKGFAYIGLFRVLKEVGLHIDYVAGTSIGSIMAGFYAAGYDPDSLPEIVRSQDWDAVMRDGIERKYIPYIDKEMGNKLVITLPISKANKGVSLMSSLSEGQNVDLLLNRFFGGYYEIDDFSKLPVPFFCIATDLFTGEAVVLDSGSMVQSIRASMSIPGYFNPVKIGNKYLVDGGVVNNYPVKLIKERGVDFAIGGDIQSGLSHDIKDLSTVTDVIMQVTGYHAVRATKEGMENTDLYIHFDMGPYDMMSFSSYDSIMAIGERTARAHYDELKALADSLNAIEFVPGNEFNGHALDSINVNDILVVGNRKVPLKYFNNLVKSIREEKISTERMESIINHMFGSGFFKHVNYKLIDAGDGKANVVIHVEETDLGELAVGVHYDTDYGGALLANAMFRNILIKGSKMYLNLQVGSNNRLRTMFVMDRGPKPGFGLATDFYEFKFGYFYDPYGNEFKSKQNDFRFTNYKFSAFASNTFINQYNLKLGADYELFSLGQNIADSVVEQFTGFNSYFTLFGEFKFDTRNKTVYSTKGSVFKGRLEYVIPLSSNWSQEVFQNATVFYLMYDGNFAIGKQKRLVFQPGFYMGAALRDKKPPFQHFFGLGGVSNFQFQDNLIPFVGTQFIQKWGLYTAVGRLKLQYNVYKKLYVILRDDFGMMSDVVDELFDDKSFMNGYGLTLAYDSFIGPVELTGMQSNIAGPSLFLSVGFWF